MKKEDMKIHIIGAGVSGLVAAKVLEDNGFSPIVFEKTDRVGGRVKTDYIEDYPLDHGFQVLLDAYPMAKKYLDYEKLDLQYFLPGSMVYTNNSVSKFGDPRRNLSFLFPTITTSIASISDKLKVFKLHQTLSKKTIVEVFESKETSTLAYLQNKGFSSKIIEHFFKPFFSGIFLEKELITSSRMFEFIFKMFSEGNACVPKLGIEEIPKQLKNRLKSTKFHFNVDINQVENKIIKQNGLPDIESDYTIIATEASKLVNNLRGQDLEWKVCYCAYFKTTTKVISDSIIGLLPKDSIINNLHYVTTINGKKAFQKELLSVTIVCDSTTHEIELTNLMSADLKKYCGIEVDELVKIYKIPKALPKVNTAIYDIQPSETQLLDTVFLAGDVTLNGSLNAAMLAGERAAEAVLGKMGIQPEV